MSTSPSVPDRAIAVTFDTVTAAQKAVSDAALTITDTYRLRPLTFWGILVAAAIAVAAAAVISRR